MRYSAAIIAAATMASAAPLNLGALTGTVTTVTDDLSGAMGLTSLTGGSSAVTADLTKTLNIVYTYAHLDSVVKTLDVIDSTGQNLLGHVCGDELTDDVWATLPINFSQITSVGLGEFVVNDVVYKVKDLATTAPGVTCITHHVDNLVTVLQCEVPLVEGIATSTMTDAKSLANCMAGKVNAHELTSEVPGLSALTAALPVYREIPGFAELETLFAGLA